MRKIFGSYKFFFVYLVCSAIAGGMASSVAKVIGWPVWAAHLITSLPVIMIGLYINEWILRRKQTKKEIMERLAGRE